MTASPPIVVVTGMAFEARIARRVEKTLAVAVAGPGAVDAQRLVEAARQHGARGVISFGVCGGLKPGLAAGRLIVPSSIVTDHERLPVDGKWHARLVARLADKVAVETGELFSSPRAIANVADKAACHDRTAAVAVDMESGPLARAAQARNMAFIAFRVISDDAGTSLPQAAVACARRDGGITPWPLVRALLVMQTTPGEVYRLVSQTGAAKSRLAASARLAAGDFAFRC